MAWILDPSSGEVLPTNWSSIRSRIWRRDNGLCQKVRYDTGLPCLSEGAGVDHIVPRSQGGDHSHSNLQVLCKFHHDRKTGQEAADGKRKRRDTVSLPPRGKRPLGSL
ncbi:HNH endonuclease [Streptomyces sp. NPDC056210]|uniref:HNH endonuclease n=1 Tax=Streptomyces sp. NPDC056210 TaxID=3345746 RepID=UPI0035DFD38D